MFAWIVIFVVLAIVVLLGIWLASSLLGRGQFMEPPETKLVPQAIMAANRQAVEEDRIHDVRFDVVRNGYRQDEVDDLISTLEAKIVALGGLASRKAEDF